ncbi:MAG: TraB/GumN family protein [Kiritimatiellae bacterium]|nr:TraB/GumN family protein [Kiritimatiellia bacterium]
MNRFKTSSSGAARFLRKLPLWVCCFFVSLCADAKIDAPFLWRLTTPGCVDSWVFGSIHIPSRALQKLPASVTDAFAESEAVICEVPFTSATLKKIANQSVGASEPLSKRLPPDLYSRCERLMQSFSPGFPLSSLDQMQLWAFTFSIFLFEQEIQNIGIDPLDYAFYKRAVAAGKQTGGLETVEEQLAAIRSFTEEEIIAMLRYSLDDDDVLRKKGEKALDRLLAAYCTGSEKKLQEEVDRSEAQYSSTLRSRFDKIMLDDRNLRMTERIRKRILAQPDTRHFFVIGTLHCMGKGSVIDRLPALGTSVQRIDR